MSRSSTRSKGARKAPAAPAEAPAPGRVQLERMRIADLAPAPYNPRQISEEALAGLGTSVDRFGLVEPVVWNRRTGNVVGGHQRLKVLQARGVERDGRRRRGPPRGGGEGAERRAQLAADRGRMAPRMRSASWTRSPRSSRTWPRRCGSWTCAPTWRSSSRPRPRDSSRTRPPSRPTTRSRSRATLIVLGNHRLLCGDSGSVEDVDRLLDGAPIHLVNTDPPYNVKVEPRSNNAIAAGLRRSPRPRSATTRSSTSPGTPRSREADAGRCGRRTARWRTTSSPTRRSTRCCCAWFGNIAARAAPRPRRLHLGRLRERRQLPARAQGSRALLLARRSSGTSSTRCSRARTSWARTSGASTAGRRAPRTTSSGRTTCRTCGP